MSLVVVSGEVARTRLIVGLITPHRIYLTIMKPVREAKARSRAVVPLKKNNTNYEAFRYLHVIFFIYFQNFVSLRSICQDFFTYYFCCVWQYVSEVTAWCTTGVRFQTSRISFRHHRSHPSSLPSSGTWSSLPEIKAARA
jgi:hypothetical protein